MGQEQRRFARVPESLPVQCRRPGSGEPWKEIKTINVSAGGLRFLSPVPFDQGERLALQLRLPVSGDALEVKGIIVWVKSPAAGVTEIGVQFDGLTPDQEISIDEFVQFLMKNPHARPADPQGPA